MYLFNLIFKSAEIFIVELFLVEVKLIQHGIMWIYLDLLYPIKTGCQHFNKYIHTHVAYICQFCVVGYLGKCL